MALELHSLPTVSQRVDIQEEVGTQAIYHYSQYHYSVSQRVDIQEETELREPNIPQSNDDSRTSRDDQNKGIKEKIIRMLWILGCVVGLFGLLYFFICSLDFLSAACRLLLGKTGGRLFLNSRVLSNPVCGVMIGILATVLVQSSSITTSIVVSMVAADSFVDVESAIPIIMGANIGTSVTNTIVAMGLIKSSEDVFRRAFAGATLHDMFNWLTVLVLLMIEWPSGFLYYLSRWIVDGLSLRQYAYGKRQLLHGLTDKFTTLIVEIDSKAIIEIASGKESQSLLRTCCQYQENVHNTSIKNNTDYLCKNKCHHLFVDTDLSDAVVGVIILIFSFALLIACIHGIVKILNSVLEVKIRKGVKRFEYCELPGKLSNLHGLIAMIGGLVCTLLLQSSSVFTSSITPLVGVGIISLDTMYPLTLGANIGTTTTGILAALATDTENGIQNLKNSLQVALCHLLFNIFGVLLWYPVPFLRFPTTLAKFLGTRAAKYRWYAIFYLLTVFGVFPLTVFGLSYTSSGLLIGIGTPFIIIVLAIAVLKILQRKKPEILPNEFKNWKFLPIFCRSLEPLDKIMKKMLICLKLFRRTQDEPRT